MATVGAPRNFLIPDDIYFAEAPAPGSAESAPARSDSERSGRPPIMAAGLEALDFLSIGVAITNGYRKLLFANPTAEAILTARDGLEITNQGVLSVPKRQSNSRLVELMRQAARAQQHSDASSRHSILAIQRSEKRPLTLLIRSLRANPAQSDLCGPTILIFIWDPELPVCDVDAGLRQLFGLTSMEARLAGLLMEGKTLDECCEDLNIRLSTARMHLGNLFSKTGVQRQGQLVSLLWKSVGMVRSSSERKVLRRMQPSSVLPEFLIEMES